MNSPSSILLGYQSRWMADRAPVKVCEKSRRIGLTWTEAADRALDAAVKGDGGMDGWYIGYNREMAAEFIEQAAEWARRFNKAAAAIESTVIADDRADILSYRIRFASGHKIVALSSRPSNLRGKSGCAVIDEAAFHDDLPALLKAALAFTMWGGAVRVISTHNGADSAFNAMVGDIRAGRSPYSLHRITLDDALRDGLFHKICASTGREWSADAESAWRAETIAYYGDNADEELFCVPRAGATGFMSAALIEARMKAGIPVLRYETSAEFAALPDAERRAQCAAWIEDHLEPALGALDPNLPTCFGEDFGRSADLTVIWPLQIGADMVRRTPFVIEMRNVPFRQQEQVLFHAAERMPNLCAGAMDARGNGQYLAEAARQRLGAKIDNVMLTEAWYREHMAPFRAAFEDARIEIPRDVDILMDLRSIVLERGVARAGARRVGADGKPRHADSAIAAALAYAASRFAGERDTALAVKSAPSGLFKGGAW
jgi:phage FluMu gp28-like protein